MRVSGASSLPKLPLLASVLLNRMWGIQFYKNGMNFNMIFSNFVNLFWAYFCAIHKDGSLKPPLVVIFLICSRVINSKMSACVAYTICLRQSYRDYAIKQPAFLMSALITWWSIGIFRQIVSTHINNNYCSRCVCIYVIKECTLFHVKKVFFI